MSQSSHDFFRQFISPYVSGPNIEALIATLADEDSKNESLQVAVNDQLTVSTASAEYLDKRIANWGIARPAELGMDDLPFRQMAIQINANKQITDVLHTVLATFYGDETVKAWVQTQNPEPYLLKDGMDLSVTLEDGVEVTATLRATDFNNITQATAREVSDVLTRFLRSAGYQAYCIPILDVDTGLSYVRAYGAAMGPYSKIQVTGGSAQTVLRFPTIRPTELVTNDTVWEVTRTFGSTLRFRWTGTGTAPKLDKVTAGDKVLIYGTQFAAAGLEGTYTVTEARAPELLAAYNSGWFEIKKENFTYLKSSLPDQVPPMNQPATPWSAFTSYSAGQIVSDSGKYWESLINTNLGNTPISSPAAWVETASTGIFYTITLAQAQYEDLMFFQSKSATPYSQPRYALAWEPSSSLLKIYLPATTKVVKRDLIGSWHLHAGYPDGNLNGAFGSATNDKLKVQILNEYSFKYPQAGYDNYGTGGTATHGLNVIDIDYVARENGFTTVVCKEPHLLTGALDAWGRSLSTSIVSITVAKHRIDDPANSFLGCYMINPRAKYALAPDTATIKEPIIAGESRSFLLIKGALPNQHGHLWFDLNKDTEEGPVPYFSSVPSNAPPGVNISSISQNGTTVTVTTITPHGAIAGGQVLISGTTNFNGPHTVDAVPSPNTYVFTQSPANIVVEFTGTSAALVDGIASVITVDPGYTFKNQHLAGADITLLEQDTAYQPSGNGTDYGTYVTGTVDGRLFADMLLRQIVAAGIKLEVVIVYPADIGLGNAGLPKDAAVQRHSDIVEVYG